VIGRAAFLKGLLVATGGLDIWDSPSSPVPAPSPSPLPAASGARIRLRTASGAIVALDVETYLTGVVPIEASPSWPAAALQAQAIVARTYALAKRNITRDYDVTATDSDQRYGGPDAAHPAATAAVYATAGRTLTYLGGPVSIFYSSCCGGHTADAAELWGHAGLPYLRGVVDPYCIAAPDFRWQRSLPLDRVRATLADTLSGTPVGAVLAPPDASGRPPSVTLRSDNGAVATLTVAEIRSRFGTDVVRSLWLQSMTFDTTQAAAIVAIEGLGRGHGVGLCQWGARGMALAGADVTTILAHYFPGTTVTGG
jgi:stage II sporulation protein D